MPKNAKLQRGPRRQVRQRGSHRQWLAQYSRLGVEPATVDAIIVPTARHADALQEAVLLAAVSDCALVALCSKSSSAAEVEQVARELDVNCVAIDMDDVPRDRLPSFDCDELIANAGFGRDNDLSFKRNFGLLLALLAGWEKVVFLDDDLWVPMAEDLGRVGTLLNEFPAVGLKVEGFPDNSVVCHANRAVGGFQETFIGGGALGVAVRKVDTFFPDVYNEDWFFLLGWLKERGAAVVGSVKQAAYNPFRNSDRAVMEEFGDCLAEGIYALLDLGGSLRDADVKYWETFLAERHRLIMSIWESVPKSRKQAWDKDEIADALLASAQRCQSIEPWQCVQYLEAWETDVLTWQDFVAGRQPREDNRGWAGIDAAIDALGIRGVAVKVDKKARAELAELQ